MIPSSLDQRSRRRQHASLPKPPSLSLALMMLASAVAACILAPSSVESSSSSYSSPSAFVTSPSSFGGDCIRRDKVGRCTLIDVSSRRVNCLRYSRQLDCTRPPTTISGFNNGLSLKLSTSNDNNDSSSSSSSRPTTSAAKTTTTRKTTTTTSPTKRYVRIEPRGNIHGSKRRYDIQTAVTTFTKHIPNTQNEVITVDLYAHIHFGTQSYFAYHNTPEFNNKYDKVFYELIVSDNLLQYHNKEYMRSLRPRVDGTLVLQSSPSDARTAKQHELVCQVDVIDYAQSSTKWIHADLTREEFLDQIAMAKGKKSTVNQQQQQPLWALASTITSLPFYSTIETFSALLRPSTPTTPLTTPITRRLFSNLFLPGDTFTSIIRALLWITVPSPELSIMVLDWSSLTPRPSGGISKIALPVLECILTGNVGEGRKLVFGQMIVSGQGSGSGSNTDDSFLVGKRNEHAIKVLNQSISKQQQQRGSSSGNTKRNALLYGAMHCQDLHTKLQSLGFTPTHTEWRTAWCVDIPNYGSGMKNVLQDTNQISKLSRPFELAPFAIIPSNASSPIVLTIGLVILPLYLFMDGLDWLITIQDVGKSFFSSSSDGGQLQIMDGIVELVLYLIRHVALYVGLAKFVVEWDSSGDGGGGLFGSEE